MSPAASPSQWCRLLFGGFAAGIVIHAFDERVLGFAIAAAGVACFAVLKAIGFSARHGIIVAAVFCAALGRYDLTIIAPSADGANIFLAGARARFRAATQRVFPDPESALVAGLVSGDRTGIPRDITQLFRDAGTAHVLAVSGYNVSQVIGVCVVLLAVIGIRRKRAAPILAACVAGFVLFTGAEASVVRAGIMGSSSILAARLGRKYDATNGLLLAAVLMFAHDPMLLRHDVGFQLSFSAVLGMHHLSPPIERVLRRLPDAFGLRRMAAETLGATVATLPASFIAFGRLALATLPANLAILPFIPLAMIGGVAAIILSLVAVPISFIAAAPVIFLLRGLIAAERAIVAVLPSVDVSAHRVAATAIAIAVILALLIAPRLTPKKSDA